MASAQNNNKFSEENWTAFFTLEKAKPIWNSEDTKKSFNRIHEECVDEPEKLMEALDTCPVPVSIAFPGGKGKLQLLHNCLKGSDEGKILGVSSLSYFSSFKEVSAKVLAKTCEIGRKMQKFHPSKTSAGLSLETTL